MARGKKTSLAEDAMIVSAYKFFLKSREGEPRGAGRTRELIHECIVTPTTTISRVWGAYEASQNAESVEVQAEERRGRPRGYEDEDVSPYIDAYINKCNKERQPISAKLICDEVERRASTQISRRAMNRLLRRLGYRYMKGESQNYLADSVQNVAYRATYLQRKVSNRDRNNNPIRPEVYLDESYVNVNHVVGKTRLGSDRKRYAASGKGTRICMIAAGIIYRQGDALRGNFVEKSFENWVANRKGSEGDYHGNFDAPQFERWFSGLCEDFCISYGPCNIYMDGAAYHKRNISPAPTTRSRKAEIVQWLILNGIQHDENLFKAQLLELVRAHKPPPFYAAVAIATMYGHAVFYTPPYHPELQPIELIWGNMKGWIGRNPAQNIGQLEEKVAISKSRIEPKQWKGAYREEQREEDKYLRALEDEAIECADAGEGEIASDSQDEDL